MQQPFVAFEFSLNVSLNSLKSVTKNICDYSSFRTCNHLCQRTGCYHSTSKTHVRGGGPLNWPTFVPQWLIRFPEFTEFTEFPFHLGKTPLRSKRIVSFFHFDTNVIMFLHIFVQPTRFRRFYRYKVKINWNLTTHNEPILYQKKV